jgi:hypothetical protein
MGNVSTTTLVGVAKIAVVLSLMGAWLAKLITWQEAVTATLFLQAVLSGVGFYRAQDVEDQKPPNA